jgi:hypothetical protein
METQKYEFDAIQNNKVILSSVFDLATSVYDKNL